MVRTTTTLTVWWGSVRVAGWLVAVALLFLGVSQARAATFEVTLDTSSLSGTAARLAFDLIDGDGVVNNTAAISGFSTDGTLGASTTSGGVTGSLPGGFTLDDTAFFNELLQDLTLGTTVAFILDVTTAFAGGAPDSFSLFLLDPGSALSLVTTGLLGDALMIVDIDGTGGGALAVAAATTPSIPVVVTPIATVPAPWSLMLVALGFAWAGGSRIRRPE